MKSIKNNIKKAGAHSLLLFIFINCSTSKGLYVNDKVTYEASNLGCGSIFLNAEVKGDEVSILHQFDGEFELVKSNGGLTTSGRSPARIEKLAFFENGKSLAKEDTIFTRTDTLALVITLQEGVYQYDGSISYPLGSFFRCQNSEIPLRTIQIEL